MAEEPAAQRESDEQQEAAPEDLALKRGIPQREHPRPTHDAEEVKAIRGWARAAAAVASDLKGEDIRILDMQGLVTYTDFLVVCSGRSSRQTKRISEEIGLRLKKEAGLMPAHVEGAAEGEWVLMDYLDFIVHVFTPEARDFYRLDVLWKEAPAELVE